MSSLVNELEKPSLWSEGEGRWTRAEITEVVRVISRGSKDGMLSRIYCPGKSGVSSRIVTFAEAGYTWRIHIPTAPRLASWKTS